MESLDILQMFSWRASERLISVLIGGLSIVLGYRMFLALPNLPAGGEAKVELPGGLSLYVTRVGPGVFFALFGALIIAYSLHQPLSVGASPDNAQASRTQSVQTSFSYASNKTESSELQEQQILQQRAFVLRDLRQLTALQKVLENTGGQDLRLDTKLQNGLQLALPRIKQTMLESVWDKNWGNQLTFRNWVEQGSSANPPESIKQIVRIYQGQDLTP